MENTNIQNTGKVEALRTELAEKRRRLLDIYAEKDNLMHLTKQKIIYKYEMMFGALENELKLKNQTAQIYEEELLSLMAKVKRGETVGRSIIRETENRINTRIRDTHVQTEQNEQVEIKEKVSLLTAENLKALGDKFRAIAKKIHPDVRTSKSPYIDYWDAVLEAYKSEDIGKITLFYDIICAENGRDVDYYNEIENLKKDILLTQRRIDFETRRLNRIKKTEPFSLEEMLEDDKKCEERKKQIERKIAETEKSIKMSKQLLISLLAGDISDTIDKDEKEFREEFFDNTYSRR